LDRSIESRTGCGGEFGPGTWEDRTEADSETVGWRGCGSGAIGNAAREGRWGPWPDEPEYDEKRVRKKRENSASGVKSTLVLPSGDVSEWGAGGPQAGAESEKGTYN